MPFTLTAMSYNVRYDNPEESADPWRRRRDAVASVIRFNRPDLIGLQEALHDQVEDLGERLPDYEWLFAGRVDPESAGEYAAIGYLRERFNLEDDGTLWLSEDPNEPGCCGWDASLPRLVRWARLREEETDVELFLFNTHFDHTGETARLESARLLRDTVDELAHNAPVVITGDFNCRAGSPPYEHLTERDKTSAGRTLQDTHRTARHDHHGPTTTRTDFRNLIPDGKIDHVLVTGDVETVLHGVCSDTYDDGCYPSDHLPVVVRLSLPEHRRVRDDAVATDAKD